MSAEDLWTAVDCACGKPAGLAPARSTSLQEINLLYLDGLVDALSQAVEHLAARLDGLESQLDTYWSVVDSPLSPAESIECLRQLREAMS